MYELEIRLKNGIGGWNNKDSYDLIVEAIYVDVIPRKGEIITIIKDVDDDVQHSKFLITDVCYEYSHKRKMTWYSVYVVPADGKKYGVWKYEY